MTGRLLEGETSIPAFAAALTGLALLVALQVRPPWFHPSWLAGTIWLLPGLAYFLYVRSRRVYTRASALSPQVRPAALLLLGTVPLLISGVVEDPWFFFLHWEPGGGWRSLLLEGGPARLSFFTAMLIPLFVHLQKKHLAPLLLTLLISIQLLSVHELASHAAGALYGSDHPSTMFRLFAFPRALPGFAFYNPFWMGGRVDASIVSSGTVPLGLLCYPLWLQRLPHEVYNGVIAGIFCGLVPLLSALAVRIAGGGSTAVIAASIYSLGVSQLFFLWMLQTGTLGACFSSSLMLLVGALAYRLLWHERPGLWPALLIVPAAACSLAWPPMAAVSLAFVPAFCFSLRRWNRGRALLLLFAAAAAALLCLPLLLSLVAGLDLGDYHGMIGLKVPPAQALAEGWRILTTDLRQGHLLLLYLGIAGLWFLPRRGMKPFWGTLIACLALISGWGETWKPQYQLARTAIPLFFVAIFPAALWTERILEEKSVGAAPLKALLTGLLLLGGLTAAGHYGNESRLKYVFMGEEVGRLREWIVSHTSPEGRILFAGGVLHGVGGGHVSYLPVLTEREMLAADFYHFSPLRVDYDYPASRHRRSKEAFRNFAELFNVTHVVTSRQEWLDFLGGFPESFPEVHRFGRYPEKRIFQIAGYRPSPFLKGSGSVRAGVNRIEVFVEDPEEEAVLKYRYVPGLEVEEPSTLRPYPVEEGLSFIALAPHGRRRVAIRYHGNLP